jgi:hypothetical protein
MSSIIDKYRKYSNEDGKSRDILNRYKQKEDVSLTKDISKQAAIGLAKGLGGSYGGLLELIGANPQENLTQIQKEKFKKESQEPAEKLIEIETESLVPEGTGRLPTRKDIDSFMKILGIETKPETPAGAITSAATEAAGGVASFGGNPLQIALATAGGASGESIREMGGPEWLATAVDLGISFGDILKKAPGYLQKTVTKKPSGLSVRKLESLKKPTTVTRGTEKRAVESIGREFKDIAEDLQASNKKHLKTFREDPLFESKLSEGYEKLGQSASEVIKTVPSTTYQKSLANQYAERGKKGFELSDVEKKYRKEIIDSLPENRGKKFTLTQLFDQYKKNNGEIKKYAPFGPSAVENEVKRDILLSKNKAIAETIEKDFRNFPQSKEFSELNKAWSESQKIKTVDSFVDSIFPKGEIDFKKAQKALSASKTSRNLENALGKEQFKKFKTVVSDLMSYDQGLSLMKSQGLSLDDLGKYGKAMLVKPKFAKAQIIKEELSKLWRRGLADPQFTRDWAKALKLFNSGKIPQALEETLKLSKELEQD